MWVKICANTSLEDTLLAAELGADAVGFVFAESKRKVTPQQVAGITSHLPSSLEKVGVFSHHTASEIAQIVRESGLDSAQLHNGYDPALVAELTEDAALLRAPGLPDSGEAVTALRSLQMARQEARAASPAGATAKVAMADDDGSPRPQQIYLAEIDARLSRRVPHSLGTASTPEDGSSLEQLYKVADAALYARKSARTGAAA